MKTKMNLAQILWTVSAFVICLFSGLQSRGQTLNEQEMGDANANGFEPVVNTDRRTDSTARVQYLWTDGYAGAHIYRRISTDQGQSWGDPATLTNSTNGGPDPFAACDIWSTDSSTSRIMYFGWFGSLNGGYADLFARSLSGVNVDSGPEQAYGHIGDRPWLAVSSANLYLSWGTGSAPPNNGSVKVAAIPGPTCSPSPCPVTWPPDNQAVTVFNSGSSDAFSSNFPIAAVIDSEAEKVFLMARQHPYPGCYDAGGSPVNTNLIRVKRSLNYGASWQDEHIVDVTGADGFDPDRDLPMLTYHITRDPRSSVTYVYAFYVLNELVVVSPTQSFKRNVLYCMASLNGGKTWNGAQRVFTISQSNLPPNGFAVVPQHPNSNCNGGTTGFYRIGRVWSCVGDDTSGTVYVAWMDNRYGVYTDSNHNVTDKDYWQVFCSRSTDHGNTWSTTPIQVSGTSNVSTASIGGFSNQDWVPPGDFLTCDADATNVYVSWPDSRNQQNTQDITTKVYFRRIQF